MTTRYNAGKQLWEWDLGKDDSRKRQRQYFSSEKELNDAIDKYEKELKRGGEFWARMNDRERQKAVMFLQNCRDEKLDPMLVWGEYKRLLSEKPAEETIEKKAYKDAVADWKKRTIASGTSEDYCTEVEAVFARFGVGREKQPIHEIKPKELEDFISGVPTWGATSKATNQTRFHSLWSLAVRSNWCTVNICEKMVLFKREKTETKIYPNPVVRNILAGMMEIESHKMALTPVVLGFFGCMRPEEIAEPPVDPNIRPFNWDDIDLKHARITVRPGVAKTGDHRTVRLKPPAVEWLQLCKDLKCPLPPVNERRLINSMRELINLVDGWIHDGLRKNCATHLRNFYHDDFEVIRDMGHSVGVLLAFYAALNISDEETEEYRSFTPKAIEAYRKTAEWKKVLKDAVEPRLARAKARAEEKAKKEAEKEAKEAEKLKKASGAQPKP